MYYNYDVFIKAQVVHKCKQDFFLCHRVQTCPLLCLRLCCWLFAKAVQRTAIYTATDNIDQPSGQRDSTQFYHY